MGIAGKFLGLGIDLDYVVRVERVTVTNAQIKALRATPKTLVNAKGSNTLLQLVGGTIKLVAGTNVLTETTDNLVVRYTNTTGAIVSQTIETTGFLDQTVDTFNGILPKVDPIVAVSAGLNKALVLHNSGDGEIAGNAANDATLIVRVVYRIFYF